jgi:hypothetical protein
MTIFFTYFLSIVAIFWVLSIFVYWEAGHVKTWPDLCIAPVYLNANICEILQESKYTPLLGAFFISFCYSLVS